MAVRHFSKVNVYNRTKSKAFKFVESAKTYAPSVAFHVIDSVKDAVSDADVICTLTNSRTPILEGEWLKKGAHINAVGASQPVAQEISLSVLTKYPDTLLVADRKESIMNESSFYLNAVKAGLIKESDINGAELCDIVAGTGKKRSSEQQITMFKSLGIAIEDIASGYYVYCKTLEKRSKAKM